MAARDRAEYMRGYRAHRRASAAWLAQLDKLRATGASDSEIAHVIERNVKELDYRIQAMRQAERDAILRKINHG